MDLATLIIVGLLLLEIPAALFAAIYLVRVNGPLHGLAPFLDRLVRRDVRTAIAGAAIGLLIVYALVRFTFPGLLPTIPSPWTSILIGSALIVFLWGPIDDAWTVYHERRKGGQA